MSHKYSDKSDREIVHDALKERLYSYSAPLVEMMLRTKDSLICLTDAVKEYTASTEKLSRKVLALNWILVVLTAVLVVLTIVLVVFSC